MEHQSWGEKSYWIVEIFAQIQKSKIRQSLKMIVNGRLLEQKLFIGKGREAPQSLVFLYLLKC